MTPHLEPGTHPTPHPTSRPTSHTPLHPRKACYAIVDFPALLRGELPPPRVPTVRGPLDVSNFDDYEMDDKYLKGGPYRGSPTDWDYSF